MILFDSQLMCKILHHLFTVDIIYRDCDCVGNVACAVHAAAKLGSQAFGMFVKRQNQLHDEKLREEEVLAFREAVAVRNLYSKIYWRL